ncbi:hypothetical protein C8Q70DRAFT_1050544 [Cubamyces menziesii]|nr:hypothetical protein C8Q70DRAFT_1050544 [Cubamyces menziesii]
MASGQLSPYPSCADGLGLMNCTDHRSASSLLTPTASVCTVSSLGAAGSESDARGRMKTMQTKDILKSPQPHRFHLVPSGRKRAQTTDPSSNRGMNSRPSAQWRSKEGWLASPGDERRAEDGSDGFLSPQLSPVLMTTQDTVLFSPQSPYLSDDTGRVYAHEDHLLVSDHLRSPDMAEHESRPTSTCSALSSQTTSVSFTLVQDQASKRFSTASDTANLKAVLRDDDIKHVSVLRESLAEADEYTWQAQGESEDEDVPSALPQCDAVVESPAQIASEEPDIEFGDRPDFLGNPVNSIHTPSASLESLMSACNMLPQTDPQIPYDDSDGRHTYSVIPITALLPTATSSPKVSRRATDTSLGSPSKKQAVSGTGATRDRRKFALRRQAIYAEYGFQIALPDSDSESSVKMLASPSKKGRAVVQGRAASASAYVTGAATGLGAGMLGGGSRWALSESGPGTGSHLGLSLSGSAGSTGSLRGLTEKDTGASTGAADASLAVSESSASGGDDLRERLFVSTNSTMALHGVLAHDRLERLSVQDDILGATRHTLVDSNSGSDLTSHGGLTTSTPPPSLVRARASERRTLAVGISTSDSVAGFGSRLGLGSGPSVGSGEYGPSLHDNLQLLTRRLGTPPDHEAQPDPDPVARGAQPGEKARLSVSRSERSARLSAWEVDPGHHPILRELVDEVDRAIEQWRRVGQMRMYF